MKSQTRSTSPRSSRAIILFLFVALFALPEFAFAQRGGFGGGFGGRGGGGTTGSTAQRREYLSNGLIGEAMITADPETRRIIIIADDETKAHIQQVIESLDQPKPQVLIKVVFVEVTHRNDSDLGVNWSFQEEISNGSPFDGSLVGQAATAFGPAGTLATGGTWTLMSNDLNATLRAIAEKGNTEVLSRPSILTRNNQEAIITVGQEVPFITSSQITDQGQTINTIQYEDVGIILRVTPYITSDGLVEMIVAPEISSLAEDTVPISTTTSARVISKRSAETVVVTQHAQTVVIGGLMENSKTETIRKVPLLGDIPLLGAAFRRKTVEDTKTELLIFLTPYVVNAPGDMAKLIKDEASKSKLTPRAFKQEDLDKFLENVPVEAEDAPNAKKKRTSKKMTRSGSRIEYIRTGGDDEKKTPETPQPEAK